MARYVLAPEAARDLIQIWRYIKEQSSVEMANRIESAIRDRIVLLARTPGAGHWRRDLTEQPVKFFPIYSHLIVLPPRDKAVASRIHTSQSSRCGRDSQ